MLLGSSSGYRFCCREVLFITILIRQDWNIEHFSHRPSEDKLVKERKLRYIKVIEFRKRQMVTQTVPPLSRTGAAARGRRGGGYVGIARQAIDIDATTLLKYPLLPNVQIRRKGLQNQSHFFGVFVCLPFQLPQLRSNFVSSHLCFFYLGFARLFPST